MTEKDEEENNVSVLDNLKEKIKPSNLKKDPVTPLVLLAIIAAVIVATISSGYLLTPLDDTGEGDIPGEGETERTIQAGNIVLLDYTLRLEDGTIVETTLEHLAKEEGVYNPNAEYTPFEFTVGEGAVIPSFEETVTRLTINETMTTPMIENPYGPNEEHHTVNLAELSSLIEEEVVEGKTYSYHGTPLTVNQINDDGSTQITIENPHPLAGKTVYFEITLLDVKELHSEIIKQDTPEVEVFIMTYCPFGLQMQKAVLPVQELLGEKADISMKFVDYTMQGEKEIRENTLQYCIQEESEEQYWAYLECFLESENSKECLQENNIQEEISSSCTESVLDQYNLLEETEGYPPYPVHSDLNQKYGVRGSPTLVINGATVQASRSPEEIKKAICEGFTEKPLECEEKLSEDVASAGFGFDGTGSTQGTC